MLGNEAKIPRVGSGLGAPSFCNLEQFVPEKNGQTAVNSPPTDGLSQAGIVVAKVLISTRPNRRNCAIYRLCWHQQIVQFKMNQIFSTIMSIGVGVLLISQTPVCQIVLAGPQSDTLSTKSEPGSNWRRTSQGWEDSSRWFRNSDTPQQLLETVHPVVWALLVLIAVVGVMIWASEEWDFARLFGKDD